MTDKKLTEILERNNAEVLKNLKKELCIIRTKKYYSYKQAAEILCISVEGLKTRLKRGQMKRVCNGNRPLIAASEIERFLKTQNPH